jgi:hypothetical protein
MLDLFLRSKVYDFGVKLKLLFGIEDIAEHFGRADDDIITVVADQALLKGGDIEGEVNRYLFLPHQLLPLRF